MTKHKIKDKLPIQYLLSIKRKSIHIFFFMLQLSIQTQKKRGLYMPLREKKKIQYSVENKSIFDAKDQVDLRVRLFELKKKVALNSISKIVNELKPYEIEYEKAINVFYDEVQRKLNQYNINITLNEKETNQKEISLWLEEHDLDYSCDEIWDELINPFNFEEEDD